MTKKITCVARGRKGVITHEKAVVGGTGSGSNDGPGELDGIQKGYVTPWPIGSTIKYGITQYSQHIPDKYWQRVAVNESFRNWGSRISGLKFQWSSGTNLDCPIAWSTTDPFFFPNGQEDLTILAYAWTGDQEDQGRRGIVFHDHPQIVWWINNNGMKCSDLLKLGLTKGCPYPDELIQTYDIRNTLTHESGHTLALEHSLGCPNCIMNWSYNGETVLSQMDIDSIQSIYGKRTLPQRIYDIFNSLITSGSEFR